MKYLLAFGCLLLGACASVSSNPPLHWQEVQSSQTLVVVTVRNPAIAQPLRAGSSSRNYDWGGDYGISPRARAEVRALEKSYGLHSVSSWPIALLGVHCVVYSAQKDANVETLLARLRQDRRVESAQPLQSFATSTAPYSDTYAHLQRNVATLHLPQVHRYTRGKGVRVAVIDTAIDSSHPDMQGRVIEQRNLVGDAANAVNERHGTAVAGIIAAIDNNQQGIVGVAPDAKLLALRACWPATPNDARAVCNTFTLAQALSAAVDLRADVVNLSLSGPSDPLLTRLVKAGIERGVLYVGAASQASDSFPGDVIGVMRVESNTTGDNTDVLHAPGTDVVTLTPAGGYDFLSGSSLAAASVSGSVALLLSHRPKVDRKQILTALLRSQRAADSGIDVCAALEALDPQTMCERE